MAMHNRTLRILSMARATEDERTLSRLRIPKYESTRGTDEYERNVALESKYPTLIMIESFMFSNM